MLARFRKLLAVVPILLASSLAVAAPRDTAANKKIDEAINQHYLATDFDKAEAILTGTVKACEDKCSPAVIARAWMYVGLVRGSGKGDQKGAKEAFAQALAADPGVKLDDALATPETKASFESAGGKGGGGAAEVTKKPPKAAPEGGGKEESDIPGGMECTPDEREVQTRRPVPVSCSTDEDAVRAELFYKEFGGEKWVTLKMKKKGDYFQAEVPCTATQNAGKLKIYVRAKDAGGETVDSWGSKKIPVEITLKAKTDAEPPAYPDKDPPERCAEQEVCPPDFPGCKGGGGPQRGDIGWGGSCTESIQCQQGLMCSNGSCESAPSCDSDADCKEGKCVHGTCDVVGGGGGGGPAGPYKKNWIGIHVAHDIAIVGGDDVCSQDSQANKGFACFYTGTEMQYPRDPQPGVANRIATGFSPPGASTTRFLLSFDRAFTPNIMIGARAGYAIGGGPAPSGGAAFLPVHAELRGSYWFGKDALSKKGLRPYVFAGGGMAQVDSKLEVTIRDCAQFRVTGPPRTEAPGTIVPPGGNVVNGFPQEYIDCAQGRGTPEGTEALPTTLDAYKKLGQGFAAAGGGAVYALTPKMGLQLNLNIMFMLPSSGQVFEPSLGFVMGL